MCASVSNSVGWLVRGGITIGDFYIDDMFVWGAALVKAYELEEKIAVYPRVILDEKNQKQDKKYRLSMPENS